jgi:hypothetical protein
MGRHASPSRCKIFTFFEKAQNVSESPPSLLRNGNCWIIPRSYSVRGREREGGRFHHAHSSNVEFRNDRKCTSIPTINVHGTDREKFTITFFRLQALSLLLRTIFKTLVQSSTSASCKVCHSGRYV